MDLLADLHRSRNRRSGIQRSDDRGRQPGAQEAAHHPAHHGRRHDRPGPQREAPRRIHGVDLDHVREYECESDYGAQRRRRTAGPARGVSDPRIGRDPGDDHHRHVPVVELAGRHQQAVDGEHKGHRAGPEPEAAVEQQSCPGEDQRLGEDRRDPDVLAQPGQAVRRCERIARERIRIDERMHELGREREHRQQERGRDKRAESRRRLAAARGRTQRAADHHRRSRDQDQARRGEQRIEAYRLGDESGRPVRVVDDPGGSECKRSRQRPDVSVRQGVVPWLARVEADRESGEQQAGRRQPSTEHDPLTDVSGRFDDLVLLDDERVSGQVSPEQQDGRQQHHDRVEDTRVPDETADNLQVRRPANHKPEIT